MDIEEQAFESQRTGCYEVLLLLEVSAAVVDGEGAALEVLGQFLDVAFLELAGTTEIVNATNILDLGDQLGSVSSLDERGVGHINVGIELSLTGTDRLEDSVPLFNTAAKVLGVIWGKGRSTNADHIGEQFVRHDNVQGLNGSETARGYGTLTAKETVELFELDDGSFGDLDSELVPVLGWRTASLGGRGRGRGRSRGSTTLGATLSTLSTLGTAFGSTLPALLGRGSSRGGSTANVGQLDLAGELLDSHFLGSVRVAFAVEDGFVLCQLGEG